jgi:hypothetical protein
MANFARISERTVLATEISVRAIYTGIIRHPVDIGVLAEKEVIQ